MESLAPISQNALLIESSPFTFEFLSIASALLSSEIASYKIWVSNHSLGNHHLNVPRVGSFYLRKVSRSIPSTRRCFSLITVYSVVSYYESWLLLTDALLTCLQHSAGASGKCRLITYSSRSLRSTGCWANFIPPESSV